MPGFWRTAQVFVVMIGVLFLFGWGALEALKSDSVPARLAVIGLALLGVFLLWKLASWIAFVMMQDW